MTSEDIIYLATPYSHPDPQVMEQRYRDAVQITAGLTNCGYVVFSPIVHSHPLATNHKMATDWKFWERIDRVFLKKSSWMIVAMMDGWDRSRGVKAEIEIAKELNIPIKYMEVYGDEKLSANCGLIG